MFIDASAIVAIIVREPDWQRLTSILAGSDAPLTSAIAVYESVMAVRRSRPATPAAALSRVERFLAEANVDVVPITADIGHAALDAFARFGRGQGHPARLNMGDCFAYACARAHGVPLLFKGDDFAQTDIPRV